MAALSGSARETEIRLNNIFSGPKKRPSILFLILMFSICLFCGNLVSCQVAQPDHGETFWYDSSSAEELPMPIYFQSLRWLNEHMEPEAGWRIISLILNEEKCDPEKGLDCFTLWAHTDDGRNELTADLFFLYSQTGGRRSYDVLARAEMQGEICGYPPAPPDEP